MTEKKEDKDIKITINHDVSRQQSEREEQEPEKKPPEEMSKEELIERLKGLEEEKSRIFDLYLRAQAEMENLKKRTKKEKEDWRKYANESLIKEILPVMDNLEKAVSHSGDENSMDALKQGVELTLKGLKDCLKKFGLEEVKAEGEPFDPCYHEAVSEGEDDTVKPGTVIHQLQKGYILNERLIRPAMVVVSKGGGDDTPDQEDASNKICENK
ncbi:MAG: nucleotide exchange factor GrpE [Deltaproteobacteria bacterium]|nr:nucleotide exchange factor GrpE [Deltaproteobacteria bacterium]MBW2015689.1 nucleotide exchange factor GrpE [Deltaproteobacteria bacterium]MBW2128637.1 nucleotide exchange factor GrpE [Deltaproteobacteria bacterium]MBW2304235.1 nucleotide exchange factor GrpE [Deltaproteobacteria bacterium]